MAQRRPVGNLLALAVLSVLAERPMHPYEMATVMKERGKDRDMRVKFGSLYTVVQNMHRHGLIEAVETTRAGGRPERTVYRITDLGRAEMRDWVRELIAVPQLEQPRFEAGLSVLGALDPDEVSTLLRRRLTALRAQLEAQRAALAADRTQVSRLFLLESEYDLTVREAEIRWIGDLLRELDSGSFPDLTQWRAFHAAQDPPEPGVVGPFAVGPDPGASGGPTGEGAATAADTPSS
jgi:DNA-binding PadR family transcriptional regulator